MVSELINRDVWATIAPSKIHGVGIFSIRDIPKGTYILGGSNLKDFKFTITDEEFMDILEPIRNIILDRTIFYKGDMISFKHPNSLINLQCFINHSDKPNSNGECALVDIKSGEEITEDFLMSGLEVHEFTKNRMNSFLSARLNMIENG